MYAGKVQCLLRQEGLHVPGLGEKTMGLAMAQGGEQGIWYMVKKDKGGLTRAVNDEGIVAIVNGEKGTQLGYPKKVVWIGPTR